jgi:hypothetical protein
MEGDQGSRQQQDVKRDRKYWIAMSLFAVLAVVIWFTFGEGTALVFGRRIEMKWIPLFVIGTFAFRTYMAREADKIRHRDGA